jgi:hypothetical protein
MPIVLDQNDLTIETSTTGSGTGNYEAFLRLADNGVESGYNTDANNQLDNKDGIWTHSLLVSDLQVVSTADGDFYEIRLDLNEIQSGDKPEITLEEFQLWVGPAAGAGASPSFTGLTNVFDLSGSVLLMDTNHGSGTDDYLIRIPVSMLTGGDYLTLFAQFSGSDDGFEEFRALTTEFTPTPDIGINKQTNGTDDECRDVIAGSTVTWTYTVENNGNVPLENVVVTDDAGTSGNLLDDFHPTYVSGDTNGNSILDTGETWHYSYTGPAIVGEYDNVATVSGVYDDGTVAGQTVTGVEEDCYNGVTPTIAVEKLTNGTDGDCPYILVGEAVVWTYNVTNTSLGAITIDAITLTDDAGTPLVLGDDFLPVAILGADLVHNIGDTHNLGFLDTDETWQYTFTAPLGAVAGEYENIVTVNGTAHDSSGNSAAVTDTGADCYFGADPDIDIVKMTNGTDDLCPVVTVGSTITWTYTVTNSGNVALTNVAISDDNGTPGDDTDDITPDAVLGIDGIHNVGDINNDGLLDVTETWQYIATGTAEEGHYDNVATVTADFTDDFDNSITVTATEDDCYVGVEGPGVRTPGFWSNWGDFWDGDLSVPKQAGTDCFADYDLLRIDSNGDGVIDGSDSGFTNLAGTPGLLIGDYDRDGNNRGADDIAGTADDEDVIFISLTDAQNLINASNKQMNDGVVKIGRDVVASWLNYLAGNPIGTVTADLFYSPREAIDDAIDYLQIFGDSNNSSLTGNLNTNDTSDVYFAGHSAVRTSSGFWTNNFPAGGHSGSDIHGALDEYNNFGSVDGVGYAHDCETQQFVATMTGFSMHGDMFTM